MSVRQRSAFDQFSAGIMDGINTYLAFVDNRRKRELHEIARQRAELDLGIAIELRQAHIDAEKAKSQAEQELVKRKQITNEMARQLTGIGDNNMLGGVNRNQTIAGQLQDKQRRGDVITAGVGITPFAPEPQGQLERLAIETPLAEVEGIAGERRTPFADMYHLKSLGETGITVSPIGRGALAERRVKVAEARERRLARQGRGAIEVRDIGLLQRDIEQASRDIEDLNDNIRHIERAYRMELNAYALPAFATPEIQGIADLPDAQRGEMLMWTKQLKEITDMRNEIKELEKERTIAKREKNRLMRQRKIKQQPVADPLGLFD